jgi:hypothetical protein
MLPAPRVQCAGEEAAIEAGRFGTTSSGLLAAT